MGCIQTRKPQTLSVKRALEAWKIVWKILAGKLAQHSFIRRAVEINLQAGLLAWFSRREPSHISGSKDAMAFMRVAIE